MKEYEIIEVISESSKNRVSLAAADGIDRPVIVKEMTNLDGLKIYQQIKELGNGHFPEIYDCYICKDRLVVIEEYIAGKNIKEICENHILTAEETKDIFLQLCEAVNVLHHCNPPIIHRDIKPSNLLLSEDGVLMLIDFDASREYDGGQKTDDTVKMGTREYAPPEQFGYSQTDERSDIYAIGAVLYEVAYGNPYNRKMVRESAPGIAPQFGEKIKEIVNRCTMFDPGYRYQNVDELKEALLHYDMGRTGKNPRGKRAWRIFAAALTAVAGIALAILLVNRKQDNLTVGLPSETVGQDAVSQFPEQPLEDGKEESMNQVLEDGNEEFPSPVLKDGDKEFQSPVLEDGDKESSGYDTAAEIESEILYNPILQGMAYAYDISSDKIHGPDYVTYITQSHYTPERFYGMECKYAEYIVKNSGNLTGAKFYTTFFEDYSVEELAVTCLSDKKYEMRRKVPYLYDDGVVSIAGEELLKLSQGTYLVEFVLHHETEDEWMIFQDAMLIFDDAPKAFVPKLVLMSGAYAYPKTSGYEYKWYLRNHCGDRVMDVYLNDNRVDRSCFYTTEDGDFLFIDSDLLDAYMEGTDYMSITIELENEKVEHGSLYRE